MTTERFSPFPNFPSPEARRLAPPFCFKMLDLSLSSNDELGRDVWILQQAASSLLHTHGPETTAALHVLSHARVHLGMSSSNVFTFRTGGFFKCTVKWLFCFQAVTGMLVTTRCSEAVGHNNAARGYFNLWAAIFEAMDECFCTGATLYIKVLQQLWLMGLKVREMSLHTCKLDDELCKRLLLL